VICVAAIGISFRINWIILQTVKFVSLFSQFLALLLLWVGDTEELDYTERLSEFLDLALKVRFDLISSGTESNSDAVFRAIEMRKYMTIF
jgi:hypothetical protein